MPAPRYAALPTAARHYIDQTSWDLVKAALVALGQTGTPLFAALPTTTKPFIGQPQWDAVVDAIAPAYISGFGTLDFPSIPRGESATATMSAPGAVAGEPVMVGPPSGLEAGISIGAAWISADDTISVTAVNNKSDGTAVNPASATYRWVTGLIGITGNQALNFPSIPRGESADLPISALGVVPGQVTAVGAPAGFSSELSFCWWASALNVITVRVTNNKADGTEADLPSGTWTYVLL